MTNSYTVAESINTRVNNSVTYKEDLAQYGIAEFWEVAGKYGDCEDYALLKRKLLLELGWQADSQFLACCKTEQSEDHVVLIVETDKGTFVLDNRHDKPMPPDLLAYDWIKCLKGSEWHELSFA